MNAFGSESKRSDSENGAILWRARGDVRDRRSSLRCRCASLETGFGKAQRFGRSRFASRAAHSSLLRRRRKADFRPLKRATILWICDLLQARPMTLYSTPFTDVERSLLRSTDFISHAERTSHRTYRTVRGAARSCSKCTAPVGADGVFRGEREPRALTFQWSVHPLEWMARERQLRRRKCCQCQKSLDATSVIVNDRTWHRKCLRCNRCDQPLKGHRYRMLNNQIFDEQCYQMEKKQPHNRRSHTTSISWIVPDPTSEPDKYPTGVAAIRDGIRKIGSKEDGNKKPEDGKQKEDLKKVVDAIAVLKKAKRLAEERKTKEAPKPDD
ncbi:hypothetical protein QR680_008264 [Steinernema hermaphroditum]|uniref:LIM zinc-binding domain-containing protein n=1 Tax=Steinernema hermaphroditum TaxID=289476 RepID=A0AA39IFZ9_9BILA|nr:hypothetical protein QR680_008264 [Steinernema hermaphroditum]